MILGMTPDCELGGGTGHVQNDNSEPTSRLGLNMVRRKSVRRAKAEASGNQFLSEDRGLHCGPTPSYSPFSQKDMNRIIDATFELMSQIGIDFDPDPALMDRLRDAGCDVLLEGRVKIPIELIRRSLDSAAKSVRLWNRDGTDSIEIDNRHTWFCPGMTCIKAYDRETGEARDSNRDDLATATRISDAMQNIDVVSISCKNVEESNIHGEIDEFSALAENTTKPLLYLCEFAESLGVAIDMAAAIRGGHKELAEKPYFMHCITPLPLYYPKAHTDQIIQAAKAGVPVTAGTVTIGGATAPITIAGCVVHSLATDLTATVLSQIVREGSFCVGSSDASFMEVATGAIGAPSQTALAEMAMCEISRSLGLPRMTSTAGWSMSRRFNQDAAAEISGNMIQAFYTRPGLCCYMGTLDEGITFSLHGLLFGDELAGQLRSLWRGIEVSDEMLAMDLTREEGPRGNYLAQEHTAMYCRRESWNARYLGANYPTASGVLPDEELVERVDRELREILLNHRPASLPEKTLLEMKSLRGKFRQGYTAPN
jgi:trimethylamine--corrinoid protein Co-methyltransferase